MADITVVGAPVLRVEGHDKVSGRSMYAADVNLPGLLWGKILRSPYPHARIRRIDASESEIPSCRDHFFNRRYCSSVSCICVRTMMSQDIHHFRISYKQNSQAC